MTNQLSNTLPVTYSVVIPVYNSEKILPELHRRLTEVMTSIDKTYEIIFVDDCGPGNSWSAIKELASKDTHVVGIQLMRNSGQGSATMCGLSHSRGEFVVTMDDDLQHPPEELPMLIEHLSQDSELDVVMGVEREKRHSLVRRLGSLFINRINSYFLDKPLDLRFTSFRVMRRSVVQGLLNQRTQYPALGPMISSITRRIKNVRVQHDARHSGKSAYTFGRILKQTMSNFIGYSMLPLRLLAVLGLVGIGFSFLFATVLLIRYFTAGISVPGWTTTVLLIAILSGFNFLAFSIIGEFVLRIHHAANQLPQYVTRTRTTDLQQTHAPQQEQPNEHTPSDSLLSNRQ